MCSAASGHSRERSISSSLECFPGSHVSGRAQKIQALLFFLVIVIDGSDKRLCVYSPPLHKGTVKFQVAFQNSVAFHI